MRIKTCNIFAVSAMFLLAAISINNLNAKPKEYAQAIMEELFDAIEKGDDSRVKHIVSSDINLVDVTNDLGLSPLMFAAYHVQTPIAKYLIKKGANLNVQDATGKTTLHYAINAECKEIVRYLLKKDANVNVADNSGKTILHLAAICGFCDLVDELIVKNVDLKACDKKGNTAMYYAYTNGNESFVTKLLAAGASAETIDVSDSLNYP